MKKALTIAGVACLIGIALIILDTGVLQSLFDDRSIVRDAVVGSEYYIVTVDNEPVKRIRHGVLISKVPLALLDPGDHTLQLSEGIFKREDSTVIELKVFIQRGVDYRLAKEDGKPVLLPDDPS